MFWKVIISNGHAFGFLFEHDAQLHPDGIGCPLKESDVRNCLVPVTEIEALAGIDLFPEFEATNAGIPIDVGLILAQSNAFFGD